MWRWAVWLGVCSLLVGCVSGRWGDKSPSHHLPEVIHGARSDEKPPLPRIELQVLTADWGSRKMRGAGNLVSHVSAPVGLGLTLGGSGSLVVDCQSIAAAVAN